MSTIVTKAYQKEIDFIKKELDKEVGTHPNMTQGIPYYYDTHYRTLYISFNEKAKLYKATYTDISQKIQLGEGTLSLRFIIDVLGINKKPYTLVKRITTSIVEPKTGLRINTTTGTKLQTTYTTRRELIANFTCEIQILQHKDPTKIPSIEKLLKQLPTIIKNGAEIIEL